MTEVPRNFLTEILAQIRLILPRDKLAIPGKMSSFEEVFKFLLDMAEREHCTIVIDEFQEFLRVNPSIFSVMQRDWDRKKRSAKVNLIVSGSINRMMEQIFAADQPLYGRATHEINLDPFTTATVKEILSEHAPDYTVDDLLALWTFTGGVGFPVARCAFPITLLLRPSSVNKHHKIVPKISPCCFVPVRRPQRAASGQSKPLYRATETVLQGNSNRARGQSKSAYRETRFLFASPTGSICRDVIPALNISGQVMRLAQPQTCAADDDRTDRFCGDSPR